MQVIHSYNRRAVDVLDQAYRIVISLKADQHNNHLNVGMLKELEIHLNELLFIRRELEYKQMLDEISIQRMLGRKLFKLMRCIVKLFNIPLSCMQYLGIQILYI
jgi:hypothetical protein